MLVTSRELKTAKYQKTQPDRVYIRNFTEDQLRYARSLIEQGYAHKQLDEIFGLPPGQKVAWALRRWTEGQVVKPDPQLCQHDIDVKRAGRPKGNSRRNRTW